MTRVNVTTPAPYYPLIRQTPGCRGVWGDCLFRVDHDDPECDVWVVFAGLREPQTAVCPPANTLFFAGEPADVHRYEPRFLAQFHTVLSCQTGLKHPRVVSPLPAYPWHVGINRVTDAVVYDYDALKAMRSIEKPRLLSVVCSSKAQTPGHRLRLAFVEKLQARFGDRLDVFGRGLKPVGDKWAAVAPYKYHVAIENSCHRDYLTEKLLDAFIAGAYPLYHGCPNAADYFPPESFTPIDIRDPQRALAVVEQALADGLYEKNQAVIWRSRDIALDRLNFFAVLAEVCRHMPRGRPQRVTLWPESAFRRTGPLPAAARRAARGVARRVQSLWRRAA